MKEYAGLFRPSEPNINSCKGKDKNLTRAPSFRFFRQKHKNLLDLSDKNNIFANDWAEQNALKSPDDKHNIISMKKPAKVDVAVLLLFFNRPETFRQVFEQVRKARPSRLLLYQDGPRGERDMAGIKACREIAEQIDWECEVHRNYQEKNYGCDPSGYMSHKWAFSLADKCIVLEDDVVPSQSFFPFCKEMLDRYEHDERIGMIAGFNTDETTADCPYDYFYTSTFSIWGWASWRRVVDKWDGEYTFMEDSYNMRQLESLVKARNYRNSMVKAFRDHRDSGKAYFESIFQAALLFNSQFAVMPSRNLINNVGFSGEGTHYSTLLNLMPKRLRKMFTMKRYEIDFPIKHPKYVIDNVEYKERLYRINAWNHPWIKIRYSLEEFWLNLKAGNIENITRSLRRRISKWMGKYKHA